MTGSLPYPTRALGIPNLPARVSGDCRYLPCDSPRVPFRPERRCHTPRVRPVSLRFGGSALTGRPHSDRYLQVRVPRRCQAAKDIDKSVPVVRHARNLGMVTIRESAQTVRG